MGTGGAWGAWPGSMRAYVVRDMPERMATSDHLYVADQFFGLAGSVGPS